MIDFDYAARQISAVLRMAISRPGEETWRNDLDRSIDGFFKSFWAIALAAPFAILGFVALHRAARIIPDIDSNPLFEAPMGVMVGVNFIAYLADWAISIGAILLIARVIDATKTVTDTIVSYNWAQVFAIGIQTVPIAIMGLTGQQVIAGFLALPIFACVLILFWSIFRRAMGAGAGISVALVVLLTLINIIVRSIVVGLALIFIQP